MSDLTYSGVVSWTLFRRALRKSAGKRWLALFVFPVLMTAYAVWSRPYAPLRLYFLCFTLASLYVPMMLILQLWKWRRRFVRSPYLREPLSGVVSPEIFIARGSTGTTEMPWSRFVKIKDAGDFILLYPSPYQFNILSREFFASEEQWQAARGFALKRDRIRAS